MKKIFFVPLILILITLPAILPFFNNKFFYTQDYIFIARFHQMSEGLYEGVFPVRWAPDLRYGEPLFNFYAPLPYYLGALVRFFGFNFIWVAKILFMLSTVLSAVTMYIFTRKLFSQKGAILATVLYTLAPYRAVDMYVRGALSETWAFVFFPLIFYASWLLAEKINVRNVLLLAVSLAGLFLTHNVTTLMFVPFLMLWWIYLVWTKKKINILFFNLLACVLGAGLASFYLMPAYFERGLIQTKYLLVGYFNFRAHFVAFSQLFSTFWGYGSSLWGRDDGLSFQVGLVNWAVLGAAFILGIVFRKNKKILGLLIFLGLSFLLSVFLQHNKSAFVWEAIGPMAFIQFPWRFLAISVFLVSLTGGAVGDFLKGKLKFVYFILIFSAVLVSLGYFKPKEYVDDKFFDKFLNKEDMHRGVDLTKDYLPVWVTNTEGERFDIPRAKKGEIEVISFNRSTQSAKGEIKVLSDSLIELPITYFPGWQVQYDSRLINIEPSIGEGLIQFRLPSGQYQIKAQLKDTPVRLAGNIISLVTLVGMLILFAFRKKLT